MTSALARCAGRRDGGLVGHWPRRPTVLRVSTFDATRLRPHDFIDISRAQAVLLDVYGHRPTHSRELPFAKLSFRSADSPHTRQDTRLQGFLYYHVPHPSRPLSGGLRFRCTPSSSGFNQGLDLLCPSGLPWTVPLPNLMWNRGQPIVQSLLRENLLTLTDLISCLQAFHGEAQPPGPVVHCPGQPWDLDLRVPTVVLIPGPRGLFRTPLYPAVARYGSALVRFEPTGNPDAPQELAIRVLELRTSKIGYLPAYSHLPPLVSGALLSHLRQPRAWTWNYDKPRSPALAAALHLLHNGPGAPSPPSRRARSRLSGWLYHAFPSEDEFLRYQSAEEVSRQANLNSQTRQHGHLGI
ncbi:hypothetical protein B0H11DRAFT_2239024 [Mycena galericulata]|nr:hypothetical protein B0H11DRAFT_2239024 [Mycena galericulata]